MRVVRCINTPDKVTGITATSDHTAYFTTGSELQKCSQTDEKPIPLCFSLSHDGMTDMVSDPNDTVYMCDVFTFEMYRYSVSARKYSKFCGREGECGQQDGNLKEATLVGPQGVCTDKEGNIIFTERQRIRRINIQKQLVETLVSSDHEQGHRDGLLADSVWDWPSGIAISKDGSMYVSDSRNHCVRQIKEGVVSTIAGIPHKEGYQDGPTSTALLKYPSSLVLHGDGHLYVIAQGKTPMDHQMNPQSIAAATAIRKIDLKHNTVTTVEVPYALRLQNYPKLMASDGEYIFVIYQRMVLQLCDTWRRERLLWIGNLKEPPSCCNLTKLPKDILKEIAGCVIGFRPPPRTQNTPQQRQSTVHTPILDEEFWETLLS